MTAVDTALAGLAPTDVSYRLLGGLFKVLPGAPEVPFYGSLADAHRLVAPNADLTRATAFANSDDAARALKVASAIDVGDVGISVYTGITSALSFFFGGPAKKKAALETDPQQAADAALKALAIAYLTSQLYEGGVGDKVAALRASPAGQALLYYYCAVEVALPFADDLVSGTGHMIGKIMDRFGGDTASKLDLAGGAGAAAAATGVMGGLTGALDGVLAKTAPFASKIAETGKSFLPTALGAADTVAGAVATGADALPMYRLLGARLVAEAALARGA